jgi:hypothetical protein
MKETLFMGTLIFKDVIITLSQNVNDKPTYAAQQP